MDNYPLWVSARIPNDTEHAVSTQRETEKERERERERERELLLVFRRGRDYRLAEHDSHSFSLLRLLLVQEDSLRSSL